MCQKCETETPYIFLDPNMKDYIEGQWRTGRNAGMKTAQHHQYIEEVEMRRGNNEDSHRIDDQYSSL
jgi:hypothetical protein